MPQQRNIAVAGLYKLVEFPQNVCACAAALPAAHIGNDAVRTKIIASVHNGKPRAERGIPADGQILNNLGALGRRAQHASGCLQLFAQKRRQLINGVSAEDKIYKRIMPPEFFHNILLLRHAARNRDQQPWICLFQALQSAHIAKHALLGMLAHRAGVKDDQIRILRARCKAKTKIGKHTLDLFAVIDILLTAVRVHKQKRRRLVIRRKKARRLFVSLKTDGFHRSPREICSGLFGQSGKRPRARCKNLCDFYYTTFCAFRQHFVLQPHCDAFFCSRAAARPKKLSIKPKPPSPVQRAQAIAHRRTPYKASAARPFEPGRRSG